MEAELRTLIRSVRVLTAWLGDDVPIAKELRDELEARGVRPTEALLLDWRRQSESSFTGMLSPAAGEVVALTYSWSRQTETGTLEAWKAVASGDDGVDALRRAAAQLRRFAAETRAARDSRLDEAEARLGRRLPADYRAFMLERDGMVEWVSRETFLDLDPIHELVHANDVPQTVSHPGLVAIGSDGSREIIGFDYRSDPPPVILVNIASAGWHEAVPQARSFESFIRTVAESGFRFE